MNGQGWAGRCVRHNDTLGLMSEPRKPRRVIHPRPGQPTREQLEKILARHLAEDADLAAFVQKLRNTAEDAELHRQNLVRDGDGREGLDLPEPKQKDA